MEEENGALIGFEKAKIGELIVDLWRIKRRAERDNAESTLLACERAIDRVHDMGFRFDELIGKPYDVNMRVRVVHQEGGATNQQIAECLSPAVYFQKSGADSEDLIKTAEVVIRGGEERGTTNG